MKPLAWISLVLALLAAAFFLFFAPSSEETKANLSDSKKTEAAVAEAPAPSAEPGGQAPAAVRDDAARVEIPSAKAATASKAAPASTQLKGMVTDSSGRPLAGVKLSLFPSEFREIGPDVEERVEGKETPPLAKAMTGSDGLFHFAELRFPGGTQEGNKLFARLELELEGYASRGPETIAMLSGATKDAGAVVLFRAGKISGRVEAPGLSLQGASVFARASSPDDLRFAMSLFTGKVAADGSFEVAGLPPGDWALKASAKGLLADSWEKVSLAEGEHKTRIALRLKEGLSIHGAVTGPQGQPIAGAELFLTRMFKSIDEMAEHDGVGLDRVGEGNLTDEQGRYAIAGLRPGEYALRVKAKGYAEASRSSIQPGGQAVDFQLGERGGIAGTVLDGKTGAPVVAGKVIAQRIQEGIMLGLSGRGIVEARTDAAGAFRIEGLEPGRYRIEIAKEGFAQKSVEEVLVQTAQETSLGSIALGQGSRLRVRVLESATEEKGVAEASAKLSLLPEETKLAGGSGRRMVMIGGPARAKESAQQRADERGFAVFENLAPGRYLVEASHPEWAGAKEEAMLGEGEERTVTLRLTQGASLCGMVLTVEGTPYASASVRLTSSAGERFDALSDGEGKYCVRRLAPGRYWAELREDSAFEDQFVRMGDDEENREGVVVDLAEGQEAFLDLRAIEKGSLSGIVRQGETPVEGVRVVVSEGEESFGPMVFGPGAKMQSSNAEGAYRIEKIKPGKYTVSASRPGAALPVKAALEIRAGENALDLVIPGGVIEGKVVDAATGKPVVGARVVAEEEQPGKQRRQMFAVSISMDDGGGGSVVTAEGGPGDPTKTDKDGKFRMGDMPAGKFRLRVKDVPGYADKELGGVELGKDERKQGVEILLERGGSVRGKLFDDAGNPVSFGILFLERVGGSGPPKITGTGPDGAFRFDGVIAGEYKLRSGMRGEAGAETELTVKAGETAEKDLRLPKK